MTNSHFDVFMVLLGIRWLVVQRLDWREKKLMNRKPFFSNCITDKTKVICHFSFQHVMNMTLILQQKNKIK